MIHFYQVTKDQVGIIPMILSLVDLIIHHTQSLDGQDQIIHMNLPPERRLMSQVIPSLQDQDRITLSLSDHKSTIHTLLHADQWMNQVILSLTGQM